MKKLLMLGAILTIGAIAYGVDSNIDENANISEASVTVKAQLVAQNLVISDLEGNPIVLDFGRVSKTRTKGTSVAETGYMVRYVGNETIEENEKNKLTMELMDKNGTGFKGNSVPVTLSAMSQTQGKKADTFDVTVGLNSYSGTMPNKSESNHDYAEYRGIITATLDYANANPTLNGLTTKEKEAVTLSNLASGDYQGETQLRVTIGSNS